MHPLPSQPVSFPSEVAFADCPSTWYRFSSSSELPTEGSHPFLFQFQGGKLLGFRASDGKPRVMSAHCSHMGSDLSRAKVRGDCLECPFHGWIYDSQGVCREIPAQKEIPSWARQRSFAATECLGSVYFYYGEQPAPPFPFSEVVQNEEQYLAASSFCLETTDCPWYLIASNAFDVQHFQLSHDRKMHGVPRVRDNSSDERQVEIELEIQEDHFRDRVLKRIAGSKFTFRVKSWRGTLLLVEAEFENSSSYGLVSIVPRSARSASFFETVFIQRSPSSLARALVDPLDLAVRKYFIQRFLKSDVSLIHGTRFIASRRIAADSCMTEYLLWTAQFTNQFAVNGNSIQAVHTKEGEQ